jgi:ATP-dependent DNA helicase RecG
MTDALKTKLEELCGLPSETEWLEFKRNDNAPDEIGEYISALSNGAALSNQPSGWLVWGVENATHRIVGTTVNLKAQKGKGNEDLEPWLLRFLDPRIDFVIHPALELPEGRVVMLEVPAARGRPVRFTHEAYVRVGSYKKKLRDYPEKERKLWSADPLQADLSSRPVEGATLEDLDPAERARLRQFIEANHGDAALLELGDDELDGALGLTVRVGGHRVPSLTGLLLIGRVARLRELIPTHEVAFQVLDGEEVRTNEFRRTPLLRLVEWLETSFTAVNIEEEVQLGLFRVPVPRVDQRAFREGVLNAVVHRDYARTGAVHVRFDAESLVISSPGGFVHGVTISNLLTTEPRPRNPNLADAMKRIGLVERTGRGVDLIYRGLLRYGRSRPDYSRSTAEGVVLSLATSPANQGFLKVVVEEERSPRGGLRLDSLLALSVLRERRRVTTAEIAAAVQKDEGAAKRTLETLIERGLVEPRGTGRGRTYTLSASLYALEGSRVAFTLQSGFEQSQNEAFVLNFARQHGRVKRSEVVELCRLNEDQATRLLKRLVGSGQLRPEGEKRGRVYVPTTEPT